MIIFSQVLLKIGQYKQYPLFKVEIESVVISRLEKIRHKERTNSASSITSDTTSNSASGCMNQNSHNSSAIFNSEENSVDRQIKAETERMGNLYLG